MRFFPIVLASLTILILSSVKPFAESGQGVDAISQAPAEDPSCDLVNRAYQKTYRSERLSFVVHELTQEGRLRRRLELRLIDKVAFQRLEPDGEWSSWEINTRPSIFTSSGPVFSDCKLLREEDIGYSKLVVYSSKWKREQYRAFITVWISETDGRIVRTRRDFDAAYPRVHEFRTDSVVDIYEYDENKIVHPRLVGF